MVGEVGDDLQHPFYHLQVLQRHHVTCSRQIRQNLQETCSAAQRTREQQEPLHAKRLDHAASVALVALQTMPCSKGSNSLRFLSHLMPLGARVQHKSTAVQSAK